MSTVDPTAALALLATQKGELANVIKASKGGPLASAKNAEATRVKVVAALTPTTAPAVPVAPTAPTTPTTPTPTSGPMGVTGSWTKRFFDNFLGTTYDAATWDDCDGWTNQNGVTCHALNISVANSILTLALPSTTSGAKIVTKTVGVKVGEVFEFVAQFNSTKDWDAGWTGQADDWPAAGENDVAEELGGGLTVNYHSPKGASNGPVVPGHWEGAMHTYSVERQAAQSIVRYDGAIVRTYPTSDNGAQESLVFNTGVFGAGAVTGPGGALEVDSATIWARA